MAGCGVEDGCWELEGAGLEKKVAGEEIFEAVVSVVEEDGKTHCARGVDPQKSLILVLCHVGSFWVRVCCFDWVGHFSFFQVGAHSWLWR